jgi:two-component system, OmpR family, KDP operon response regulator KdpE
VLSADGTEGRKAEVLEGGADDYVTKPFGMREVNARIRVARRHHSANLDQEPAELRAGRST